MRTFAYCWLSLVAIAFIVGMGVLAAFLMHWWAFLMIPIGLTIVTAAWALNDSVKA